MMIMKKTIQMAVVLLLACSFSLLITLPALADDKTDPNAHYYTLSQIQELAVKNNRITDSVKTGLEIMTDSKKAASTSLGDLDDSVDDLNGAYSSASSSATSALTQINAAIKGIQSNPALASDTGLQAQLLLLNFEKTQVSTNVSLTKLSVNSSTGIIEALEDNLEGDYLSYSAQAEDLAKSSKDVDNQVSMICTLLFSKDKELEKSIDLLTAKHELQLKLYNVEQVKLTIGYSTTTEVVAKEQAAKQTAIQLQQAKDGLMLIKRQINDLIGRSLDDELELADYIVPEIVADSDDVPVYSDKLVSAISDKCYKIDALERDIKNYHTQINAMNVKNSHKKEALEACIDLKEIAIKDASQDLDNAVKSAIDTINATSSKYTEAMAECSNAKVKFQQSHTALSLGLISKIEYQVAELTYNQTELAKLTAGYDYYLALDEYNALENGQLTDIYEKYKTALAEAK